MLLNVGKCKVMYLGVSNDNAGYFMDNRQSQAVVDERDLGIVMQNNLKVSKQCAKVVGTANRVLCTIYRTFTCNQEILHCPYTRVMFVLAWSTAYRHDVFI